MKLKPLEQYRNNLDIVDLFNLLLELTEVERLLLPPLDWLESIFPGKFTWGSDPQYDNRISTRFEILIHTKYLFYIDAPTNQYFYTSITSYEDTVELFYNLVQARLNKHETQITPVLP